MLYDDVAVDNCTCPTLLTLKQSKTDPFHAGVMLNLGETDKEVCPGFRGQSLLS